MFSLGFHYSITPLLLDLRRYHLDRQSLLLFREISLCTFVQAFGVTNLFFFFLFVVFFFLLCSPSFCNIILVTPIHFITHFLSAFFPLFLVLFIPWECVNVVPWCHQSLFYVLVFTQLFFPLGDGNKAL